MKQFINSLVIMILFISVSCEQYEDPIIDETLESRDLLQNRAWLLIDYEVTVKNSDIKPPLFLSFNNDSIVSGNYNIKEMIDAGISFPTYKIKFTDENTTLIDSINSGNYLNDGTYLAFNATGINLGSDNIRTFAYQYLYNTTTETMQFTLDAEGAQRAIDDVNNRFIRNSTDGMPAKIGDAIARALGNPIVQNKIHDALVQKLAAKIQGWLNDWDPAVAPINLAEKIMQFFKDNDLQGEIDIVINEVLKELFAFHKDTDLTGKRKHEKTSKVILKDIFDHPDEAYEISTERMAALILPELPVGPVVNPEQISEDIIDAIGPIIKNIFTPERISKIVTKIIYDHLWENLKVANNFKEVTITLKHE